MKELIGKECIAIFNLPANEWPIEGYPAWVKVLDVNMPMIKMASRFSERSMWVNANIIKTIELSDA